MKTPEEYLEAADKSVNLEPGAVAWQDALTAIEAAIADCTRYHELLAAAIRNAKNTPSSCPSPPLPS